MIFHISEIRLRQILLIHWVVTIVSLFYMTLGLTATNLDAGFIEIAKWVVIFVFFWVYFSMGYVGIPFFHPYRMFLVAFFVFLLGRIFLDIFNIIDFASDVFFAVGLKFRILTQFYIILFLIFFLLFFQFGAVFALPKNNLDVTESWKFNLRLYAIGKFLFWAWMLPAIYYWYQYISYVLENGYINLTIDSKIISPNIFVKLADDFFSIGFFLILASKPDLKKLRWPTIIYVIVMLCTLLTGRRIFFFTQMLTILTYYGFRGRLSKKVVVVLGVIMVALAIVVGTFRSLANFSFSENVDFNTIGIDFFASQGISAHTLGVTQDFLDKDFLSFDIKYFFEPLNNVFNLLFNAMGDINSKRIVDNYFLADKISYFYNVNMLGNGAGLGSSLVAEFYIIGGFPTLILGAFLFGFIFIRLVSILSKSNLRVAYLLIMLPMFFFSPRAHPFQPFTESIKPMIIIFIILLIDKVLKYSFTSNKD